MAPLAYRYITSGKLGRGLGPQPLTVTLSPKQCFGRSNPGGRAKRGHERRLSAFLNALPYTHNDSNQATERAQFRDYKRRVKGLRVGEG